MGVFAVGPKAEQDIDEIAIELFNEVSLEIGLRFLDEVYLTFGKLAKHPQIGWWCKIQNPRLKLVRVFRVSERFKEYLIFYLQNDNRVEITRVLHGAQDLDLLFGSEDIVDRLN